MLRRATPDPLVRYVRTEPALFEFDHTQTTARRGGLRRGRPARALEQCRRSTSPAPYRLPGYRLALPADICAKHRFTPPSPSAG